MSLLKEVQPNYQRQADEIVANHALEISKRTSPSKLNTEAATIELGNAAAIAQAEDSRSLKKGPSWLPKNVGRKNHFPESMAIKEDYPIGAHCLVGGALESVIEKAKETWRNIGILKADRAANIQKLIEHNKKGGGKDIESRWISDLPQTQPISPIWAEAGGDD